MNYSNNVQLLLMSYYLGHGGDSVGFIAASLDLPDAKSLRHHYYRNNSELSMMIVEVGNELKEMAMRNEIIKTYNEYHGLTIKDKMVFNINNKIHTDLLDLIEIEVGFDFGWQKRVSGHRYDSLSGHGFL